MSGPWTVGEAASQQGGVASARARVGNAFIAPSLVEAAVQLRHNMIDEAAYQMARARGFKPGHELDDWLLAERQIDAALAGGSRTGERTDR